MKRLWLIAILVALGAATAVSSGASHGAGRLPLCRERRAAPEYRQVIAKDRVLLRRLYDGLRAPGLSLTVATRGRIVWSVSCGYADLATRRPVTAETRFRIGSVSKPLTATALAHYAEIGRVDLDAPVDRYVDFPSHHGAITLRRLAGHLAGIRHYESRAEAVNRHHFPSLAATLARFADDPLVAEPGTRFSYSSYGYDVIGAALERVTSRDFASLMHATVLAPASMRRTTLMSAAGGDPSHLLRGRGRRWRSRRSPDRPQRPPAGWRFPLHRRRPRAIRDRADARRPRQPQDGGHDVPLTADACW